MADIKFPEYRDYYSSRVEVNDAMAALLVGSKLAAHTLSLTAGSTATLGQLFPGVEHISRYNMKSDLARNFLGNADHYIASVAVPYALATHEDFVMRMIDLIENEGKAILTNGKAVKAWNMHAVLFDSCGEVQPEDWIQTFHVLRETRNCITHAGGRVNQQLRDSIANMGPTARAGWQNINNGASPEALEGADGGLVLTAEHVFTAFAVTKCLGRKINALLGRRLEPLAWARIAVTDFDSATTKAKNSTTWRRSLIGYVKMMYATAPIAETHLEQAARELGLWTIPNWSK